MNSVHPGFVETPLAALGLVGNPRKTRMDATPLGRYGKPTDIAFGCLYLASDETAWMTGSELVIDDGMTATSRAQSSDQAAATSFAEPSVCRRLLRHRSRRSGCTPSTPHRFTPKAEGSW